jgi:repressor LexA
MKGPSERQLELLRFADTFTLQHGYPPSVRELGEGVGLNSSCTVQRHLGALARGGYIRRQDRKSRTLELTQAGKRAIGLLEPEPVSFDEPTWLSIPLLGAIAAGSPILAEEYVEDHLRLEAGLIGGGAHFALRVQGDSMIGAGILEGDIVVIRQQASAENGELVAALLDDSATIKRFFRRNSHVELRPENPAYKPIVSTEARVLGKVVLVLRSYT